MKKKKTCLKCFLYFGKWNFLALKNLIKLFHTIYKTPLGETGCFSSLYNLLAAQASSFLIHPPSQTQSVRTILVLYHSLCSTCVTYVTPYHTIGHQVLITLPFIGKKSIFLRVASILKMCLCPHF